MIDLTGSVFGELTVVEFKGKNTQGQGLWLCRCSCGKEKVIRGNNLRSGKTKSCGHIRKNNSLKYIGSIFGNTKVLSLLDKKPNGNGFYVNCKCLLCGKEFETTLVNLKKGFRQSCGCDNFTDLTGKKFGNLTVVEFMGKDSHGHSLWKCRCDCGNELPATTSNLNYGAIVNCGCRKRSKAYDMVGKVYGYTKVIDILDEVNSDGGTIAMGKCLKCGKEFKIHTKTLKKGFVSSCGCYKTELLDKAREDLKTDEGKQKSGLYSNTSLPNILSQKPPRTNTTGVKGVQYRNGKYIAYIGFQGKSYYLGSYEKLEEAAAARKTAEEELVTPVFEQYLKDVPNKGKWFEKFIDSNAVLPE